MVAGFSLTGPKPGTISVESHDSINQEHRQIFPRAHKIVCQCRRLGCNVRGPGAFSWVEIIGDGETKKALDKSLGVEGKSGRW